MNYGLLLRYSALLFGATWIPNSFGPLSGFDAAARLVFLPTPNLPGASRSKKARFYAFEGSGLGSQLFC